MRSICFRAIFLTLLTSLLVACVQTASAQPLQLVTPTTGWKYNQSGGNLGTAWRASAYDDTVAGWQGPGTILFGFETNILAYPASLESGGNMKTVFPDPVPQKPYITNYYFRTHFNMPAQTAAVLAHTTLISTNYIDDGAVFYLNGAEWFRFNMAAAPAVIFATTLASATLVETNNGSGTIFVRTNLATNLLSGDNVLAVEVHQSSVTSSDEVFGSTLAAILPTPIVITKQPIDQTVGLGTGTITNSVVVTGYSPVYQWYSNSVKLTRNAFTTNPVYTVSSATTNVSADYYCVITNFFGAVTSDVATISVVADIFPPLLVSALASDAAGPSIGSNVLLVTFSKALLLNSTNYSNPNTNPANYIVTILGTTNRLVVTNVTLSTKQVRLTVNQGFIFGTNYVLTVNHISDTKSNIMVPNSMIGIGMAPDNPINIMPYYQAWRENESSLDLGTAWRGVNYNEDNVNHVTDGYWGAASSGLFAYDTGGNINLCNGYVINSSVSGPFGISTFYFRTYFQTPTNTPSSGTLVFNLFNDDGVIYYLNGVEVLRNNMPAGNVTYSTPSSSMRNPSCITVSAAVTNLFAPPRTNVLAAELHQGGGSDFVVCFGVDLDFSFTKFSPLPPMLKIVKQPTSKIISWTNNVGGLNWGLQYATGILKTNTVWTSLPNNSPFNDTSTGIREYRLQVK